MQEENSLKAHLTEPIGVFGTGSLHSLLESSFGRMPYSFVAHTKLSSLREWVELEHPRLLVIEAWTLESDHEEEQSRLHALLEQLKIVTVLITRSPQEIERWRNLNWPNARFHNGKSNIRNLKSRILSLLAERIFMGQPLIAICTEKPYLTAHLEMFLKNYGMRVCSINHKDPGDRNDSLACEEPNAVLWDVDFGDCEEAFSSLKKHCREVPSFFLVAEHQSSRTETQPPNREVYTLDRLDQLMGALKESVLKHKNLKLKECRDDLTGLYLPEFFSEVVQRELTLSSRCNEKFSVMRIAVKDHSTIEEEYGPIFARELMLNLGLFIQERVRSSDIVAKGRGGEVWLLLSKLGRDLATLVGERLRHSFLKAASFQDETLSKRFQPELSYAFYSYPADFKTSEELFTLMESRGAEPTESLEVHS